ncbi:hypothetical protein HD806DRAFT_431359 [Xylariaceae sp. AK1471]|nr:hypothetical protein HD806DRAFT_431359 [Xylariaceae sp. AK1471]
MPVHLVKLIFSYQRYTKDLLPIYPSLYLFVIRDYTYTSIASPRLPVTQLSNKRVKTKHFINIRHPILNPMSSTTTTTIITTTTTPSTMRSLKQHIEAESARWTASRGDVSYSRSTSSSSTTTSSADSIFTSSHMHSKYNTHKLSRRSSTSSFATEFEPEPEAAQQPFVVPRDFSGAPITVYASLEAAVAQSTTRLLGGVGSGGGEGQGQGRGEEPRRLVTPGKLYENEEDDDEIVYA